MTDKNSIIPFIDFAQELIYKYDWSEESEHGFRERLSRIKTKQLDDKLNLSVVGEFSIGKSSFISALIRREVLESAALQGTTVASTILDYSPIFSLVINYKDGRIKRFEFADEPTLCEYLKRYSTEPEYAEAVDSLRASFPSESLEKAQVRIIDTPGTNSLEMWHEETTIHAINELSDASIVLVDATKPLPESQKDFIKEHLEDVLDRCAFVVTKIDLIRPRERDGMLQYIKGMLEYEFGLENPFVISYSSLFILRFRVGEEQPSEEDEKMLCLYEENEEKLYRFIAEKKSIAQAKKTTALLENLYNEIDAKMPLLSTEYENRHEMLERTRNTDLSVFISEQVNRRAADFYARASVLEQQIINEIYTPILNCKIQIMKIADSLQTKNEMKQFAQFGFVQLCRSYGSKLLSPTEAKCARAQRFVTEQLEIFKTEFAAQYTRLGLLVMPSGLDKINIRYNRADIIEVSSADSLLDIVTGRRGGFLERIALISPSVMREQLKEAITEPMNDYFARIAQLYEENVRKYMCDLSVTLGREITRYYRRYNSYVTEKIAEDELERRELERKLDDICCDMQRISDTQRQLREIQYDN